MKNILFFLCFTFLSVSVFSQKRKDITIFNHSNMKDMNVSYRSSTLDKPIILNLKPDWNLMGSIPTSSERQHDEIFFFTWKDNNETKTFTLRSMDARCITIRPRTILPSALIFHDYRPEADGTCKDSLRVKQ